MKHVFAVGPPDAGRRIERFLQRALGDVPPSLVQKLLRKGDVRRNGARARAGEVLASGDELIVHHRAQTSREAAPPATLPAYTGPPVSIVGRDADYLALCKPAGARCSIDENPESSLQSWIAATLAKEIESGEARPELCHRLDAGTTGIVLVALNAAAFTGFHRALEGGQLRKIYHVLVFGRPERTEWVEQTPLRRLPHAPKGRPKVVGAPGGEAAATRLRWLGSSADVSLLEAEPITGRTHQIRAHLYALGLPVLGDPRYGDPRRERNLGLARSLEHQLLHAHRLDLPGPPRRSFRAPHPPEFVMALRKLRLSLEPDEPGP